MQTIDIVMVCFLVGFLVFVLFFAGFAVLIMARNVDELEKVKYKPYAKAKGVKK